MTEQQHLTLASELALKQMTENGLTEDTSFTPSTEIPDEMEVWTMGRTVYNKIEKTTRVEIVDVLITMAWPEDRLARGVTISFDVEFMGEGDIYVPKEESRFGIPYLIQTWHVVDINFNALIGKRFNLHVNHYNSAIIVMAEQVGVSMGKFEIHDTFFEHVWSSYGDGYRHYIPYRRRIFHGDDDFGKNLFFEGFSDPGWDYENYRKGVKEHYFWLSKHNNRLTN